MLASHATSQGFLVVFASLAATSINASFRDPHTSSGIHLRLGSSSYISRDRLYSSFFFVADCSRTTIDCYEKLSSRRALAILTSCNSVGDSCRVCCKPPLLLGFSVELLLRLLLSSSCAQSPKRCQKYLCTSPYSSSRCSTLNHSTRCTSRCF